MPDSTVAAVPRPNAVPAFRAAHRVRGNHMMGRAERDALAGLLEVLSRAGTDLPLEVLSACDQTVELLVRSATPSRLPSDPYMVFPIPARPVRPYT